MRRRPFSALLCLAVLILSLAAVPASASRYIRTTCLPADQLPSAEVRLPGPVRMTREEEDAFVVTVSDDGVGFDPEKDLSDGREHVGIRNVRERVQKMCGGSLSITSREGEGTTAVIRIPK